MPNKLMGWLGVFVIFSSWLIFGATAVGAADLPQSNNYRLDESTIGSNGLLNSTSASYQASTSTGDLSVGSAASSGYQVDTGSKTTNDPTLSFAVINGSANFGSFSPIATASATTSFSVSDYTSYGYIVQIFGNNLKGASHVITGMATTGPPQTGIEQFGINLVANTKPINFGANPNNGQFGFGSAASNYNTANVYRLVDGETIASAPKSSGTTIYTISYIVNVSGITPAAQYTGQQTIIITGTY